MLDKNYDHKKYESEIYKMWEESGAFSPIANDSNEPFCIIMPPPNANGELHLGHATFVAVSDALIRYHRMIGSPTLWLPGVDHAGIQTQVTFEKKLKKEEDKTRYDLGREEFHRRCYEFALKCKTGMENQMKALGSSCDWTREKFTLDPEVSKLVYETFEKMHAEGLVYRGYRIVNWCPRCRSTLADVELEWEDRSDPLYFIKYGQFTIATARPETKFRDTALAVNPKDKRYKDWIGKTLEIPGLLGIVSMTVIADTEVDMEYGTGMMKVTPAHDAHDFELGQKYNLPVTPIIDFDGRMDFGWFFELKNMEKKYIERARLYHGKKVLEARKLMVEHLIEDGLLEKIDENYSHSVSVCERCGAVIEPMVSRQWFVKINPLADKAIKAVENGEVKIRPKKYESMYFNWMRNIRDWPISRQIWWGHQLPVWYRKSDQLTSDQLSEWSKLESGDTRARTDVLENPIVSVKRPDSDCIQDPDTFDTWFSSGQWPVNTLKASDLSSQKSGEGDFERFYPTSVMNTAYEILFLWVARMIMFGIYLTGKVPFNTALINGVLRDEKGAKMSKSKGNGVNPNEAINRYGADAVRMALLAGRDNGNDLLISKQQMEERIRGYRNFSNKLWNVARFVNSVQVQTSNFLKNNEEDEWILNELNKVSKSVTEDFEKYRLGQAAEDIYDFVWHKFADIYLEKVKSRKKEASTTLFKVLTTILKLLHPFMPFVTEAVYQELKYKTQDSRTNEDLLINASWPEIK